MKTLLVPLIGLLAAIITGQTPQLVRDIMPGAGGSMPSTQVDMLPHGRLVVFPADDGNGGTEPWRSDGTTAGTYRLSDIEPGTSSSWPTGFTALGGLVFFNAWSTRSGHELYVTDGTTTGTRMVADLSPGPGNASPSRFVPFRNMMLFVAYDGRSVRVFRSDGTAAGTRVVSAIPAAGLRSWTVAGNLIYYVVYRGIRIDSELWVWTGTGAPTLVRKFPQKGSRPLPEPRGDLDGRLVFTEPVFSPLGDTYLWSTNGTATGTVRISPILQNPFGFAFAGNRMFYVDRQYGRPMLRVSDGTFAGDRAVRRFPRSGISPSTAVGDRVFFLGDDGGHSSRWSIWVSDGTTGGTRSLNMTGRALTAVGTRKLAFVAEQTSSGDELWITDGTGVQLVADLNPGAAHAFPPTAPTILRYGAGRLWAWADDGKSGLEPRVAHLGAGTRPVGTGCATGRWPELHGMDPVLGRTTVVSGRSTLARMSGVVLLGVPALVPATVAGGCAMHVDITGPLLAWTFVTDATGAWSLPPWRVPALPALDGITLAAQAGLPQAGGTFGMAISNGVLLTAGL